MKRSEAINKLLGIVNDYLESEIGLVECYEIMDRIEKEIGVIMPTETVDYLGWEPEDTRNDGDENK